MDAQAALAVALVRHVHIDRLDELMRYTVGRCPYCSGSAAGGRTVYLDRIDVGRQQQDHALRNGTYLADENVSNEFI